MTNITQLKKVNNPILQEINHLFLQLSEHAQPLALKELQAMLKQKHLLFFASSVVPSVR